MTGLFINTVWRNAISWGSLERNRKLGHSKLYLLLASFGLQLRKNVAAQFAACVLQCTNPSWSYTSYCPGLLAALWVCRYPTSFWPSCWTEWPCGKHLWQASCMLILYICKEVMFVCLKQSELSENGESAFARLQLFRNLLTSGCWFQKLPAELWWCKIQPVHLLDFPFTMCVFIGHCLLLDCFLFGFAVTSLLLDGHLCCCYFRRRERTANSVQLTELLYL